MKHIQFQSAVAMGALAFLGLSLVGCDDLSSGDPYYIHKAAVADERAAARANKGPTPLPSQILTKQEAAETYTPLQSPAPDVRLVNEAGVFLPGTNKAYAIGRYRDPGNSAILHEPHVVLRHEEDSSFVTNAGRDNEVVVGQTRSGSSRRYTMIRPAVQRNELGAALTRSEEANAQLTEETKRQKASSEALLAAVDNLGKTNSRNTQVLHQVSSLQGDVDTMRAEIANLKSAQAATPVPLPASTPAPTAPARNAPARPAAKGTPTPTQDSTQIGADGKIQ